MINNKHFQQFPDRASDRLIFRQFTLEDAKDIYAIRSHPKVMQFMDSTPHSSLADAEKFVAKNIDSYQNAQGIFWAIVEKSSGNFIGDFSYWNIDKKNVRGEIGYTLKPEYWGKGYMRESMQKLLYFGLYELQLHSIEANINPNNNNSRKALLSMGFKKEAYFRENYFYDGKFLDSEIYALLKSDFIST